MDLKKLTEKDICEIFTMATGETHSYPIVDRMGWHQDDAVCGWFLVLAHPLMQEQKYSMIIIEEHGVSMTDLVTGNTMHIGSQFAIIDYINCKCK